MGKSTITTLEHTRGLSKTESVKLHIQTAIPTDGSFFTAAGGFCHPRAVACAGTGERVGTFAPRSAAGASPVALRSSASADRQNISNSRGLRPGSFLILLLFIREITPHERPDCIDRFAHMSRSDKNMPRAVYLLQNGIFINLLRPA